MTPLVENLVISWRLWLPLIIPRPFLLSFKQKKRKTLLKNNNGQIEMLARLSAYWDRNRCLVCANFLVNLQASNRLFWLTRYRLGLLLEERVYFPEDFRHFSDINGVLINRETENMQKNFYTKS